MNSIWYFEDVNLFNLLCPHKFKEYSTTHHSFTTYKKFDFIYINDKREGIQKQWYESGSQYYELSFTNDQENGMQKAWRENGKPFINYEVKDGVRYGLQKSALCYTLKNEKIKIWKAEITDQKGKIGITLNDNLLIACKNFAIQVLEIQRPGKKIQKVKEFLLGYKIPKASKLF